MDDLGDRLVDAVLRAFPGHAPGTRPVHSRGIGVSGHFLPSEVAGDYCTAEHFSSRVPVAVTVRFSNSSGLMSPPDFARDVRGMAVKFHLSDGVDTDLIAITVPVFPARTVDDFLAFTAAAVPVPVTPVSPVEKLVDLLGLRQPLPTPAETPSNEQALFRFAAAHPVAVPAALAMASAITPVSYARAAYHAIHAFRITGHDGTVLSVRFHWDPAAGVRPLTREDLPEDLPLAHDYLRREIGQRLAQGPVEFALRIQVADIGDDTSDPTKPWPWRRRLVDMGTLSLSTLVEDEVTEGLSFNPTRLVDGIACSDDEILATRGPAYRASWDRRAGSACPFA